MRKSIFVVLVLLISTQAFSEDLYKYWKKRGIDISTDDGCLKILETMNYDAKKDGPKTAILNWYETAKAIRGKSEACKNIRLGTIMVAHAYQGTKGNVIEGYKLLRKAASIYRFDASALIPKM
jgi:hypothetical protein